MFELPGGTPFYPNACQYCQQDSSKLKRCSACKIFGYCCKEHQGLDWRVHKGLCKALKRVNETVPYNAGDYAGFVEWRSVFGVALAVNLGRDLEAYEVSVVGNSMACEVCFKREGCYECAGCKSVWYCGVEHEEAAAAVHKDVCDELKICRSSDLYRSEDIDLNALTTKTHTSRIKTIGYALDAIAFNAPSLSLHVVGASHEEARSLWDFSLIRDKIPTVKTLNIHFIGPEAVPVQPPTTPGMKIKSSTHQLLYHEIVDGLPKPDLIVLFNAGLHENSDRGDDPWKASVGRFCSGAAIALTAYCLRELERDVRLLGDAAVVLDSARNPFYAPKPFRERNRYTTVFYSNRYIYICK